METIRLTTLRGVAIKGSLAHAGPGEAFTGGSLQGDNMTLVFTSSRMERVSPRKVRRVNRTRLVACERRWTPERDDFWWVGIRQTAL